MSKISFEDARAARVDDMLDACTRCGACFTACPITGAAGIGEADPQAVVTGVLDIVRLGAGPEASRKWASSCIMSGECIKACDYGVNPRFLLSVARLELAGAKSEPSALPPTGVRKLPQIKHVVTVLARLPLSDANLQP